MNEENLPLPLSLAQLTVFDMYCTYEDLWNNH